MLTDRRQFLKFVGSFGLSASAAAMLSGCNTMSLYPERQKVALLLPLTGRAAAIGKNLERSAKLTLTKDDPFVELIVLDTKGDAASAAAAAEKGVRDGAQMALGPVFGAETQAAASAINGRIPLIAFTNDANQINQDAFIFGFTPDQSVSAILAYAKGQGLRRIAVVTQSGELSAQAADAATRLAEPNGITITAVVQGGQDSLSAKIRSASGGKLPDAVLLPDGGDEMIRDAEALSDSGMQLLGTEQWLGSDLASMPAFDKAWFAAPVPPAPFSDAFAAQQSATPGILAGLAYDAVNIARVLAASGDMNAEGVMRTSGFNGALGKFRFRSDRSCDRSLAILSIESGAERVIATSQQT